ncbi:hypothetical protein [Candidatus Spongiihabitans sp.]|uniref:hypothetical protein n=1 Tax=Candidatus Spongiihabitans sp. TaxID=3101308 RepID=UPI003C7A1C03
MDGMDGVDGVDGLSGITAIDLNLKIQRTFYLNGRLNGCLRSSGLRWHFRAFFRVFSGP